MYILIQIKNHKSFYSPCRVFLVPVLLCKSSSNNARSTLLGGATQPHNSFRYVKMFIAYKIDNNTVYPDNDYVLWMAMWVWSLAWELRRRQICIESFQIKVCLGKISIILNCKYCCVFSFRLIPINAWHFCPHQQDILSTLLFSIQVYV